MEDEVIDNLSVASLIKTEALAYMKSGERPISLYVAMVAQYTDRTQREVPETILGEPLSFEIEERLAEIEFFMSVANVGGSLQSARVFQIYYRSTGARNGSLCNQDAGWTDPRPTWVGVRLREALAKKADDAAKYAPTARPLWLLLTVESEHLYAPFVPDLANNAMAGQSIDPFDRVIIWSIDCPLFVFDADAVD